MTTYYLYVKVHNVTGLKYLGKTIRSDYHRYTGSGKYWLRHLKKHGFEYTTTLLMKTTDKEILKLFGIYYSKLWNIVSSKDWANLNYEKGDGGGPMNRIVSESQRKNISKTLTGRKFTAEHRKNISASRTGRSPSDETRQKMSDSHKGKVAWNKGKKGVTVGFRDKKHSDETKKKISESGKGRLHSDETKRRISESGKGKHHRIGYKWWNNGFIQSLSIDCPDKTFKRGRLKRKI